MSDLGQTPAARVKLFIGVTGVSAHLAMVIGWGIALEGFYFVSPA